MMRRTPAVGAAIVAALLIRYKGWTIADPIASIVMTGMIIRGSWSLVKESVDILLESTPAHIDVGEVRTRLEAVPDVESVHDLHVWTISDGIHALSCHLRVEEASAPEVKRVVREVKALLDIDFAVSHSTIETECDDCAQATLYCSLETHHHSHSH